VSLKALPVLVDLVLGRTTATSSVNFGFCLRATACAIFSARDYN